MAGDEKSVPSIGRPREQAKFPTILAVGSPSESWMALIEKLEQAGYLVLLARSGAEALHLSKTHSRPICLLLMDDDPGNRSLISELSLYQPGIRVLLAGSLSLVTMLTRVGDLLHPPKKKAADE